MHGPTFLKKVGLSYVRKHVLLRICFAFYIKRVPGLMTFPLKHFFQS